MIDKIDAAIGDASASGAAAYQSFQTVMSGIEGIAKVLTSTGVPTNPGGLLLGAMSLALDGFSYIADKIAKDPPDANFKEIAATQPIDLGFLQSSLPNLSVFETGKAVLSDILSGTQALISILVSMERLQGAEAAGDQFWVLEQAQQLSDALVAYNDITVRLQNNWDAFMSALASDGVLEQNKDTVVDGSALAQALSEDGFFSVADFIDENNLSGSEISDIISQIDSRDFGPPTEQDFLAIAGVGHEIYETGDLTLQIRETQDVPEPASITLIALGLLMLVALYRKTCPATRPSSPSAPSVVVA